MDAISLYMWSFILILCILAVYLIAVLIYYNFPDDIESKIDEFTNKLKNNTLRSLLNGSGVYNIPNIHINTMNRPVLSASLCSETKPLYLGPKTVKRSDCISTCVSTNVNAFNVTEDEVYLYESQRLKPGGYCLLGSRPACNLRLTYAIMTANSIQCRSKFPRLISGDGNLGVACNNRNISDPRNVLWDNKYNQPFDPHTVDITSEDEKIGDRYRFECHFNGRDKYGNRYIAHPYDRFQPIPNYCTQLVPFSASTAKPVFDSELNTYTCECNKDNISQTNIRGPTTPCSPYSYRVTKDAGARLKLSVPVPCFNTFSPISDVTRRVPCPPNKFTIKSTPMTSVDVFFTTKLDEAIECPNYEQFVKDEPESNFAVEVRTSGEVA